MAVSTALLIKLGSLWNESSLLAPVIHLRIRVESHYRTGLDILSDALPTYSVNRCWCLRFLRHVPVIYVDYPGEMSLKQIYGTFNRAMLRMIPALRSYADPLTAAMAEFYLMSQVCNVFEELLIGWSSTVVLF